MIAVAAAIHLREIMAGPGLAVALWLVQAYSARDHSRCLWTSEGRACLH
jgi:hypothetical protein